jgi:hypothetical protein
MDKVETSAGKELNKEVFTNLQKAAIIPADSAMGVQLAGLVQSQYVNLSGDPTKYSVAKGSTISLLPKAGGLVEISGFQTEKGQAYVKPLIMRQADLPQAIKDKLDLSSDNLAYKQGNMQGVSRSFRFNDYNNTKELRYIENNITGNKTSAYKTTKQETLVDIRRDYGKFVGTEQAPTQLGVALENMTNAENLVASVIEVDGEFYKQLGLNDGTRLVPLFRDRDPINPTNYESVTKNIEGAPGLFANIVLNQAFAEYNTNPESTPEFLKKILKYYGGSSK